MKKITKIFFILFIFLSIIGSTIKAASFSFLPTVNSTDVEEGQTITIDLKLSDIDVGNDGINTFKCIFKYDENIFENVQVSPLNNWSITYNDKTDNEKYGTLLAVLLSSGVSEDQTIGSITLKVKNDCKGKTGNITFTDISTNNGQDLITENDKSITVTVKGDFEIIDENISSNPDSTSNNVKDNTISEGTLPQTGIYSIIILIIIAMSIVFCVISFTKSKQIKN